MVVTPLTPKTSEIVVSPPNDKPPLKVKSPLIVALVATVKLPIVLFVMFDVSNVVVPVTSKLPLTVALLVTPTLSNVVAPPTDNVPVVIFTFPSVAPSVDDFVIVNLFEYNPLVTLAVDKDVNPVTPNVPPIEVSPVVSEIWNLSPSAHNPPFTYSFPVIEPVVIVASDTPDNFPPVNVALPSVKVTA